LAKNIYYEAASEPEEGKVAVGLVTINRSISGNFPTSICGVVNQKTVYTVPHTITKVHMVTEGKIFKKSHQVTETVTTWTSHAICQFSWKCETVHAIKKDDARWDASVAVAQELLDGGYDELREKYRDALYFHERHIKPAWAHQKQIVEKIGGHIFYSERQM
jgi:spore germination cell wall hydrolase CwlJ-like protein